MCFFFVNIYIITYLCFNQPWPSPCVHACLCSKFQKYQRYSVRVSASACVRACVRVENLLLTPPRMKSDRRTPASVYGTNVRDMFNLFNARFVFTRIHTYQHMCTRWHYIVLYTYACIAHTHTSQALDAMNSRRAANQTHSHSAGPLVLWVLCQNIDVNGFPVDTHQSSQQQHHTTPVS